MISCIFGPILPPPPRNLLLTYFNVFGVSGPLGGLLLHKPKLEFSGSQEKGDKGGGEKGRSGGRVNRLWRRHRGGKMREKGVDASGASRPPNSFM